MPGYTLIGGMGENKRICKQIAGQQRQIEKHLDKIALELSKPYPDRRGVAKWYEDIARMEREIARLEAKLPGGKR
jgi:ubiquinone biosynthesis protein UbiJ